MPPGAYPPGAYPPGAYPPGAMAPGAMPPGAYPPGYNPLGAMAAPGDYLPPGAGEDDYPPSRFNPYAPPQWGEAYTPPRVTVTPDGRTPAAPRLDDGFPPEMSGDTARKLLSVPLPQLKNIRITFYTDEGVGMLMVTPDQFYPKEEVNQFWVRIGIPLSQIQPAMAIGGKMHRMVISSDEPAEFLVGRLAFVRDSDPIEASMLVFPPFLEAKKRIFFAARVTAGLTPYEVTWDFDTDAGESEDAVGERVTYTFPTEGVYTITCTVRDKTGAKPPVTSVMGVKVSRPFEE